MCGGSFGRILICSAVQRVAGFLFLDAVVDEIAQRRVEALVGNARHRVMPRWLAAFHIRRLMAAASVPENTIDHT